LVVAIATTADRTSKPSIFECSWLGGLLFLVIAGQPHSSTVPDGVNLVDEDDRRCPFMRRLELVAYS
jgi:hypothetical protein